MELIKTTVKSMRSVLVMALVAALAGVVHTAGIVAAPTASAQAGPGLVPEKVRTDTPFAVDGTVSDIAQVGTRIVVGGTFTSVKPTAGAAAIPQKYLYAYDLATGAFDTSFAPVLDGAVEALEPSPDGTSIYVVGLFNTVSGQARKKVVKLSASGAVDPAFVANANAKVSAVEVSKRRIWIGGKFTTVNGTARGGLAALDATTGAVKKDFDLPIAGGIGYGGELTVKGLGITPDLKTLIVSFTGQSIGGVSRVGVAQIDVSVAPAVVSPWKTTLFQDGLVERGGQLWLRGFDIAADGSYFAVTTSGGDAPPINDMVIAFPVAGGDGVQPRWLSRHFDSVFAVAIDAAAVYTGGHYRFQEAPGSIEPYPGDPTKNYSFSTGPNGIGAGVLGTQVVARLQLGALDPVTGKSLAWNPGSDAFNGVTALTVIPRGLLLGHDGVVVAGKSVGRAAFFDRNLAVTEANESTITSPTTGEIVVVDQPRIVRGTATAPSGVKQVQVTVQNRRTKAYLQANGTWAATFTLLKATLDQPGTRVTWQLPVTFPAGGFEIKSRAFGIDGTKENDQPSISVEGYSLTDSAPETTAKQPSIDGRVLTLTGTATDDFGVAAVKVSLRNTTQNAHLQADGSLGSYYEFDATLSSAGATGTNWSLTVTIPDGNWYMQANAIDSIGQRDGTPTSAGWDLFPNDTAPTVVISTPSAEATIAADGTVQLSGTATDDRGVARVQVYLLNQSTYQGMTGVGVFGDRASWVSAVLASPNQPSTTWSLTTPPLPPGRYIVQANVTDTATRNGTSIPAVYFNVQKPGDARPTVTMTTPGNAAISNPVVTVAGTATDATGVTNVRVSFYSNAQPYGWLQADGTINGQFKYEFEATLGSPGAASTNWNLPNVTLPHAALWSVHTYSLDTAFQPSNPAWAYPRLVLNDAVPTFTLDTPTEGQIVTGGQTIGINGTVADDVAVGRVVVYLYRDPFWEGPNPQKVGTSPALFDAFITSPGSKSSNWSFTSPALQPGRWMIYAYAIDAGGQNSTAIYRRVILAVANDAAPTAFIDTPTYGKTDFTSTAFAISGRATDDKGVSAVTLRLYRMGTNWLKPDLTLTAVPGDANWAASLASPGATSTTWSLNVDLPAGGYYLYAFATDSVGQRQTVMNWANGGQAMPIWVTPGDALPTVAMTAPTANSTITGATFSATGTASDDRGVAEVWVLVRRTTDRSIGLRRDGTIGTAEYVPATLGSPGATSTTWTLSAAIPSGNWEVYVYATDATTKQAWASAGNLTVQ